ncbi:hypothetical protein QQX98_011887 [Neonectria punicea]|uniref:Heterokaryon incompatibility domain-containing protein n=1 Tax=Neonectria punicea TaxID=979145 RepID=A0ABR1GKG3_9HYPO
MDNGARHANARPSDLASTLNLDLVESWERKYSAAESNDLGPESELIRAVESDKLDYEKIENRVQQLVSATEVAQGFCGKCRHLLEHWPDLGTKDWAHAVARPFRTEEIEAATRAGCKFCAFLLSRLNITELLDTFRKIEARLETVGNGGTASLSIQNWAFIPAASQLLWLNFPGRVADRCNANGARAVKFESHVLSPTSKLWEEPLDPLDMARIWLRECGDSHEVCRSAKKLGQPTRLISISNDAVKLVLTENWEAFPPYATLSYCWGRKHFPMLTRDKLDLFLEAIPIKDLPQTFKDAIRVARTLGLAYIWIDSLCIIQQDDNDWRYESGQMRSVYGGTHVNLAASSATSVYEGLCLKPTQYSGGFCARVTTSEYCRGQTFHASEVYNESSSETYLATRAWTFQEKLLAPRTISFGAQGVFWECRSGIKSEFLPDGFPGLHGSLLVGPENRAWDWSDIVWNYSAADLTHGSDKLAAISGIAARQHAITGEQYLAGMWRRRFITQLPWSVRYEDPTPRKKRPEWRAPTWSWASVDGQVAYWAGWDHDGLVKEMEEYIRVLDVWTIPSGSDPFGPVSGGELSVACSVLVRGYLVESSDFETTAPLRSYGNERVLVETGVQPFGVVMDCLDDEYSQRNDPLYLLPLFGSPSSTEMRKAREERSAYLDEKTGKNAEAEGSEDEEYAWPAWAVGLSIDGIILRKSGKAKGHFRRVGSFRHWYPKPSPFDESAQDDQRKHYQEFMQVWERAGRETADAECAGMSAVSNNEEARYIITIE